MSHRVIFDSPFVRVYFSGTVSASDLMAAAAELERHEDELGWVPDRLVDLSEMVAAGITFHVAMEAARQRRVQEFPNAFRSALFAPTEASAGFAKIFQTINVNPQIEVRLFTELGDAEAWLRGSVMDTTTPPPVRRHGDKHGQAGDPPDRH